MSDEIKKEETEKTPDIENIESPELTDKQLAFCREYVVDFNATKAAIRAGYSDNPESAAVEGSRQLRKAKIKAEINRISREIVDAQRDEVKARVLHELSAIGFDDLSGSDTIRDREGNAIGVNRKDRLKALELLGKYAAMFTENVNFDGKLETTSIPKNPEELEEWYKSLSSKK